MSHENLNHSAESDAFNQRFETFKNKFSFKVLEELDSAADTIVAIEKTNAVAPIKNEIFSLQAELTEQATTKTETKNALQKMMETLKGIVNPKEKNQPTVPENLNLEIYRIPAGAQKNAVLAAQKFLEEQGLAAVIEDTKINTNKRLGHSCVYSYNGTEEFA